MQIPEQQNQQPNLQQQNIVQQMAGNKMQQPASLLGGVQSFWNMLSGKNFGNWVNKQHQQYANKTYNVPE